MNSIKQATSGLASSLFLAAGLTRLAEKIDPMANQAMTLVAPMQSAEACEPCTAQCYFTAQAGQ